MSNRSKNVPMPVMTTTARWVRVTGRRFRRAAIDTGSGTPCSVSNPAGGRPAWKTKSGNGSAEPLPAQSDCAVVLGGDFGSRRAGRRHALERSHLQLMIDERSGHAHPPPDVRLQVQAVRRIDDIDRR